ncbi:fungal specific transcription factor domain-containing protein 54 [Elsinoe australis]|uniref:Fungal specific transcription factor domain-containing protein 54 n=1 Tax=Elsinoe australis TaxID=40998 RepID=A0A4U7AVX1_9PEZI|nr:fungal specific transcription factor domain-containing protein 54 [Elsinoe australis]
MCCQNKAVRRAERATRRADKAARRADKWDNRAAYYDSRYAQPGTTLAIAGPSAIPAHHAGYSTCHHQHHHRGCCGHQRRGGPITAIISGITTLVLTIQEKHQAEKQKRQSATEKEDLPATRSQMSDLNDEKVHIDEKPIRKELMGEKEEMRRSESTESLRMASHELPPSSGSQDGKSPPPQLVQQSTHGSAPAFSVEPPPAAPMSGERLPSAMHIDPALHGHEYNNKLQPPQPQPQDMPATSRSSSDDVPFNELQNPSDALDILASIASNGHNHENRSWRETPARQNQLDTAATGWANMTTNTDLLDYYPLRSGTLTYQRLASLLDRYHTYYHPYYPLIQRESLNPANLARTAQEEPHLLTAVLVIASKDLVDEPNIFKTCSEHMQALVSALAAGGAGGVEAVEALLLLAEWTPYTSRRQAGSVGRGEEDREAWMHVGTALRVGYFLGLDRYSFHIPELKDPQGQRKRLVWIACFISDRQISIRTGRAFWSRGPSATTTLRKDDFPSLRPQGPGEDDYATIFQATLELTMLFSNVHDVLYSNPSGVRSHLSGGYIKFIDDFRSAIYGWNSVYGTLTCSQNLKATLLMSYDYLRLYTNAFAFHATIQRALPKTKDGKPSFSRVFYNNVGAVGDARFIYEGLDAAKSLLTTMNNFVDPEKSLRYMPLRFHLYTIYAGVFLYRARTVGVMSPEEDTSVRRLVSQTVSKLEAASVGDSHPGSRYSQLLKLLWDKVDRKRRNAGSLATIVDPYRPGGISSNSGLGSSSSMGGSRMGQDTPGKYSGGDLESPGMTERMGDFSWTDLDAIGNFAVNGNEGLNMDGTDWWAQGFLPADNNPFGMSMGMDLGMGGDGNWGLQL